MFEHQPWRLEHNKFRALGGREIARFRGEDDPRDTELGAESWIGSTTAARTTAGQDPDFGRAVAVLPDGRTGYLYRLIAENPEEILGRAHYERYGADMGVLVKFLDPKNQYGLQCHPTRPWAKKMWDSDYGKEESWYVLGVRDDTPEPPFILLGFKEGVTRQMWEERYFADDIAALENMCHKIYVKPGEAYIVKGGCPHALGAGCFVLEVQEPNDITVSARTLTARAAIMAARHDAVTLDVSPEAQKLYNEQLLGAYIYEGLSGEENLERRRMKPRVLRSGQWGREELLIGPPETDYFSFTRLTVNTAAPIPPVGFASIAIVSGGGGKLTFDGGEMDVKKGDELFLPADIPGLELRGQTQLLLCRPGGVQY